MQFKKIYWCWVFSRCLKPGSRVVGSCCCRRWLRWRSCITCQLHMVLASTSHSKVHLMVGNVFVIFSKMSSEEDQVFCYNDSSELLSSHLHTAHCAGQRLLLLTWSRWLPAPICLMNTNVPLLIYALYCIVSEKKSHSAETEGEHIDRTNLTSNTETTASLNFSWPKMCSWFQRVHACAGSLTDCSQLISTLFVLIICSFAAVGSRACEWSGENFHSLFTEPFSLCTPALKAAPVRSTHCRSVLNSDCTHTLQKREKICMYFTLA